MAVRADLYIHQPSTHRPLEWLGSIGYGGDPHPVLQEMSLDLHGELLRISSEADWRESVTAVLEAHEEATHPDWGWPWPWNTSESTDYAYVWSAEYGVDISNFGMPWNNGRIWTWPDMSAIKTIRWDAGNAPMVFDLSGRNLNPINFAAEAKNRPKEPNDTRRLADALGDLATTYVEARLRAQEDST